MKKKSIIIFVVVFIPITMIGCSEENTNTDLLNESVLPNGSILNFSPLASGGVFSSLPAEGLGSWFSMETSPGALTTVPITTLNGLVLGSIQLAKSISPLDGSIDRPWIFFGNFGAHQTVSDSNVLSTTNNSATIDFSGWSVTWNAIPIIDMSKGAWNGNADGVAILTCGSDCSDGDSYVLTYSATVPSTDPSGFSNVQYSLHLEGAISSPPP